MKKSLRITVSGKVQNVGLQNHIKERASKLQVEGTSEHHNNGQLLVYASGEDQNLELFIDSIYEGTSSSEVEGVEIESQPRSKDFRGVFRIIGGTEGE